MGRSLNFDIRGFGVRLERSALTRIDFKSVLRGGDSDADHALAATFRYLVRVHSCKIRHGWAI
jgi:hypothetical protein